MPTTATVRFDAAQVRASAELDSPVINTLDSGCEIVIVETVTLASGRERVRIDAPVEGWLSRMFVEDDDADDGDAASSGSSAASEAASDGGAASEPASPASPPQRRWPRGAPLSAAARGRVAARPGNGRCYDCGAALDGLASADGEGCYGDAGRGVVVCGCLLYTSPSPRDATLSRMPSSA